MAKDKVHNFKDKCESCGQFKICRGFENKILCEECIKQEKELNVHSQIRRHYMNGIERIKVLASQVTDKALLKIIDYLITREDMNENYLNEEKSLKQMVQFIRNLAQKEAKNEIAMIEDEVVFGWAIHYWDESNEKLKLSPSGIETKNQSQEKSKKVKKESVAKEWHAEGQLSIFDVH